MLDLFKVRIPDVSIETRKFFDLINNGTIEIEGVNDFSHIFNDHKITESREELEEFLRSWDGIGDVSQSFQKWMIDNGNAISTFTSSTKKTVNVLKSLGASLASM